MDLQYTFRDLMYLMTGIISVLFVLIALPEQVDEVYKSLNSTDVNHKLIEYFKLKDNSVMLFLISIPIFYLIGYIVQIIDLLFTFDLAKYVNFEKMELEKQNKLVEKDDDNNPKKDGYGEFEKTRLGRNYNRLYKFTAGATVESQIKQVNKEIQDRQKKGLSVGDTLLNEEIYNEQEYTVLVFSKNNVNTSYNYIIKELFNGLRTSLLIIIPFLFCIGVYDCCSKGKCTKLIFSFIYIFLCWLFFRKARNAAHNYIYAINSTYKVLQKNKEKTMKNEE